MTNKGQNFCININIILNQTMTEDIIIKIQDQQYKLKRQLLSSQTENMQIKSSSNITLPLPEWVTKDIYLLIQRYLKTKDVKFLNQYTSDHSTMIKLLRVSDYLGMTKFHQIYINQVLIPNLNHENCTVLLEQTQKKLKNLDNRAQCWFALLNNSINYISTNLYEIYKLDPGKIRKMNQKILNEILDRTIRLEKRNNYESNHLLFNLIMQTKDIENVSHLCWSQRNIILQKKINPKIHAKLSWKLQNLFLINEKRTKVFKFLELEWYLEAIRDYKKDILNITLNLMKKPQIGEIDQFAKIGAFYTKLIQNVQQSVEEAPIIIYYLQIENPKPISVLSITNQYAKQIGNKKLELNIYCSLQQVYSFILNYILHNFDKMTINTKLLTKQQIKIFIQCWKKLNYYEKALHLTNDLLCNAKLSFQQSQKLLDNYNIKLFSNYQEGLFRQLCKNAGVIPSISPVKPPVLQARFSQSSSQDLQSLSSKQPSIYENSHYRPQSAKQSKTDYKPTPSNQFIYTPNQPKSIDLRNSRGDSRSRNRKIFEVSPNHNSSQIKINGGPFQIESKKQEIFRITDIQQYIYDKNSAFARSVLI